MSKNYNGGKSRKKGSIIKIIAIALCTFMLGVGLTALTAPKELNEKNLIKKENYVENLINSTQGGLDVNWDDDGSFSLSGKHKSEDTTNNSKYRYHFVSVTLNAGEYQISSGNKFADTNKYGLYYVLGNDTFEVLDEVKTFTVAESTVVQVGFFVKNNERIVYADFEPVLVAKGESTNFFAE